MRPRAVFLATLAASLLTTLPYACPRAHAQAEMVSQQERDALHRDPQWAIIAAHLPDPKTATAAQLETAGDVLRARKFPEDSLDYYGYAMARGGPVSELLNRMGVVRLELHQTDIAHELFQRTVRVKKSDASAWNNLGVTEYVDHRYRSAISDYHRAAKLDKHTSVYHVNMGMAYFENADMESARKQFSIAMALDPHAFEHRDAGGGTLQVVGSQNYSQLAFEMARVFARNHDDADTILWLSKATEAGFDTKGELASDPSLRGYERDPRVLLMLKNAQQMRARAVAAASPVKSLGDSQSARQVMD